MTTHTTECPHCKTRFRVTGMQLTAARGTVRCGACLELFDATKFLSSDEQAPPPRPPRPAPTPPKPTVAPAPPLPNSKDDGRWIHDDLDLESVELDEELSRLLRQELVKSEEPAQRKSAQQKPATPNNYDESWAEALLQAEKRPAPSVPSDEPPPPAQPAKRQEPSLGDLPARDNPLPSTPEAKPTPPISRLAEPDEEEPLLLEVEDEPLLLTGRRSGRSSWRALAWGFLILLAALGLLAQYATYNFDELSRVEAYRPWFEKICPLLECQVPPRVDISRIKSSNLVVRSHREFEGALSVDAIIYNRADFAQPFPLLELRFADINDTLIASRRFKPSEYLAGELAGQALMPPQTPIHIALEILDPGSSALNYSISFHSPE